MQYSPSAFKVSHKGQSIRQFLGWIAVLTVLIALFTHLGRTAIKGEETKAIIIAVIIWSAAIMLRLGFKNREPKRAKAYLPYMAIPIILTAIWGANSRLFGKFDVSATIFHLQHGVKYDGLWTDVAEFSVFLILGGIAIACLSFLARRDRRVRGLDMILALPLLLVNPLSRYAVYRVTSPLRDNIQLTDYYVESAAAMTQTPKNLLMIYAESVEDTYRHERFGDVFDAFHRIENQGVRLNGVAEIRDTGWTIAGLTASQCGVPLMSLGLVMNNRMKNIKSFLPGAKCLGTTLQDQGYQTVFMGGANLTFAGKGRFLKTHGYQEIWGTEDYPKEARGSVGQWGLYEDALLDFSLNRLRELEAQDAPYFMSVLTLAAHFPRGYLAPSCAKDFGNAQGDDPILSSVKCTGVLIEKFLQQAQSEDLLKDTIIVILSDHLGHRNTQSSVLEDMERQNLIIILGSDLPQGTRNVEGSMIDVYPTVMDVMGQPFPEGRQGLGVSMIGSEQSLLSVHGLNELNRAITYDNALRTKLWALEPEK